MNGHDPIAEALDAFLTARLAGREPAAAAALPPAEAALAAELVRLAAGARPDPAFVARLERELGERRVPERRLPDHRARPVAAPRGGIGARRGGLRPGRAFALAALAVVLALAALLAVPQVRATVVEILRLGSVVIIFGDTPTPPGAPAAATLPGSAAASPAASPVAGASPVASPPPIASPRPTVTPLPSIFNLAGATTLADARRQVPFPVGLPAYPPDLGAPDYVFLQDLQGPAVVLVWTDPANPAQARLSLQLLGPGAIVFKPEPEVLEETTVNGERALWTTGPYMLAYDYGDGVDWDVRRLITGHVLIWTDGDVTYRLEIDAALEEAVRIAESVP